MTGITAPTLRIFFSSVIDLIFINSCIPFSFALFPLPRPRRGMLLVQFLPVKNFLHYGNLLMLANGINYVFLLLTICARRSSSDEIINCVLRLIQ